MISEEAIFAELFARMADVKWTIGEKEFKLATKTRTIKLFNEVPAELQPWCGQAEHGDSYLQVSGMPYKTVLEATWIVYQCAARGGGKDGAGTIQNNVILDGIKKALEPKPVDIGFPDRRNTLGNLVYHCYIGGRLFKDPGDIDGQGMMTIPIKLLVP